MAGFDFDLFVIGGGSGGVRAARVAAEAGARVGLAEQYRYGGTCVIRGCVPKKLMVYASSFADAFHDAAGYGWSVGGARFDWQKFIAAKDAEDRGWNRPTTTACAGSGSSSAASAPACSTRTGCGWPTARNTRPGIC